MKLNKHSDVFLTKGEALVRGIFAGLLLSKKEILDDKTHRY